MIRSPDDLVQVDQTFSRQGILNMGFTYNSNSSEKGFPTYVSPCGSYGVTTSIQGGGEEKIELIYRMRTDCSA